MMSDNYQYSRNPKLESIVKMQIEKLRKERLESHVKIQIEKLRKEGIEVSFRGETRYVVQIEVKKGSEQAIIKIRISPQKGKLSYKCETENELSKECISIMDGSKDNKNFVETIFE